MSTETVQQQPVANTPPSFTAKAGRIKEMFKTLSCPIGSNPLYNPLPLTISGDTITCNVQSTHKSSYVFATFKDLQVNGSGGQVTVDALQVLKYLDLYNLDENVTITFGEQVVIESARKRSVIYTEVFDYENLPECPPFNDGRVSFKSGPATASATIKASDLSELVSDARVVEADTYPIEILDGFVKGALGTTEAKKNHIETTLVAETDGTAKTVIGVDFGYVFSNTTGIVQLQTTDSHPLVVVQNTDDKEVVYVLAPRRDE